MNRNLQARRKGSSEDPDSLVRDCLAIKMQYTNFYTTQLEYLLICATLIYCCIHGPGSKRSFCPIYIYFSLCTEKQEAEKREFSTEKQIEV